MTRKMMSRTTALLLALPVLLGMTHLTWADSPKPISSIAVEAVTGLLLHEENADIVRPPASMIKLMAMLLVAEGVDAALVRHDSDRGRPTVPLGRHSLRGQRTLYRRAADLARADLSGGVNQRI